jgi:2-amino-4-hydroxy-6-hydroxymethyldihydropteridine diphosphokinase
MKDAYLLIGSNLGDRKSYLRYAIEEIQSFAIISRLSGIFESVAWGYESDHPFLNQCILTQTEIKPDELLGELKEIEKRAGRIDRTKKYTDRVLDLDILFFGEEILESEELTIPHPRLHLRAFTLVPLAEIAPAYIHPVFNKTILELLKSCPDKEIPVKL